MVNTLVWPNPSTGVFNFNIGNILSDSLNDEVIIQVFDITGKLVHQEKNLRNNAVSSWDASLMAKGVYLVNLKGNKTSKHFKIIKK